MKEPKSSRGLVHQAICNLNITLPVYTKVLSSTGVSQCITFYLLVKGIDEHQSYFYMLDNLETFSKSLTLGVVDIPCFTEHSSWIIHQNMEQFKTKPLYIGAAYILRI